jgi:uncharacterized membrane protein
METLTKIIRSNITWMLIIYLSSMFLPWREIYKGTSVFTVLPLWWEYGNPVENYLVILGHIVGSIISGSLIALVIKPAISNDFESK